MMDPNGEPIPSTSSSSVHTNGFGSGVKKATKNRRKRATNAVPIKRVEEVMKFNPHMEKVKYQAVALTSHATELFIKDLIKTCYRSNPKALTYDILANAIAQTGNQFLKEAVPKKITYQEYLRLKKEREAEENDDFFDEAQQQEDEERASVVDVDEEKAEDEKEKDNEDEEAEENDDFFEEEQQEDQEHGYAVGDDEENAEDKKDKDQEDGEDDDEEDDEESDSEDESEEKEEPIYYDHFVSSQDDEDENQNDNDYNVEEFGELYEESIVADEEARLLFQ